MIHLLAHLQQRSIRFLLIGGRGLELLGYVRNTLDLDLLVSLAQVEPLKVALREFGYAMVSESSIFSRWGSPDPGDADLDVLYVDLATFEILDADAVTAVFGEIPVRAPSVAGMIALKLHAMRNNPDRRPRDTQDIQALLNLHPGALDLAGLRALCDRYGPAGIFDTIHPPSP